MERRQTLIKAGVGREVKCFRHSRHLHSSPAIEAHILFHKLLWLSGADVNAFQQVFFKCLEHYNIIMNLR